MAIGVPAISDLIEKLRVLGLEIEGRHDVPSEGVVAAMVPVGLSSHFRIELLEPTSENSPIAKFLEKRPKGGLHHICFAVSHIERWYETLQKKQIAILPPGIRKAARGKALFIHPKEMGGVLVELEEIS